MITSSESGKRKEICD